MPLPQGKPHLVTAPTWEVLFADPDVFMTLPPEVQDALYEQVAILEIKFRLGRQSARIEQKPTELDRVVLVEEAAKILATSVDTLYSKWRKLPFAFKDQLDGKIKFRVSGIERYIASRRAV